MEDIGCLHLLHFIAVHNDNRGYTKFLADTVFQTTVAGLIHVHVVDLRLLLLHTEHSVRHEVYKQCLGLHVVFYDVAGVIHIPFDELILQAKYSLVIFLRRRCILQKQHGVPLFHRTSGEHTINCECQRFPACFFAFLDLPFDVCRAPIRIGLINTGDIDDLIFAKVSECICMTTDQRLHCITGSAIRQNADDMAAHISGFDLFIVQEPKKLIIIFASVND